MADDRLALETSVIALRPFLPAKDFETSLKFYADLGFEALWVGEGIASMHLGPFSFLLQKYEAEFAQHFMMHLLVNDLDKWWRHIEALDLPGRYGVRAPAAPALQPWGLVVSYVWDPCGVLWHIARESQ